ncbi:MAG: transposase [Thermoguttaceae bacterium]|jgi:REP element-mobilizing transposase RayT
MSKTIAADVIAELGELHYGRKRVQPAGWVIRDFRNKAEEVLKFPILRFEEADLGIIACSIGEAIRQEVYTCYACAIMPDHVHVLIRKHKKQAEDMIEDFQSASRLRLRSEGRRTHDHPVWGGPGWKVFLDRPDDIQRTIRYIEQNPVKWKLPQQQWEFVKPYDGWPLHPGHSPNSPYARRLRECGEL